MDGLPGYPVELDIDILLDRLAVKVMEGDCAEFDDDLDDDLLRALPLDFPEEEDEKKEPEHDDDCYIIPQIKLEPEAEPPVIFPFPFEPYPIQEGFMKSLYKALEGSKIGIFESPTGTGKSLSMICGSLQWLRDHEERERQELQRLLMEEEAYKLKIKREKEAASKELDWIAAFAKKQELCEKTQKIQEECEHRLKREARLNQLRKSTQPNRKKRKRNTLESQFDDLFKDAPKELKEQFHQELGNTENEGENDEAIVVEEYFSDDDKHNTQSSDEEDEDEGEDHVTKIYYCSRTHSQLAQFVREIQKSPFGEDTRVVSLGSRQNLCINDSVRKLKSNSMINERCLEMQKNKNKAPTKKTAGESASKKKKTCGGCPFYKQEKVASLTDQLLVKVQDVEQIVAAGRRLHACPYYASRHGVPAAQLVALPYQMMLHRQTRQASGIQLAGNIVIIDEAHNLVETISNIHSVEVTGSQFLCAYSQLNQYMERYRTRLKAKNLMYIKQILFILSSLVKCIGGKTTIPANQQRMGKTETRLQTINDFLFDTHLDNLNLFKVLRYCQRSQISKKLHSFVEKYEPAAIQAVKTEVKEEPPTWALSKFLKEISQSKANNNKNNNGQAKPVAPSTEDLITMLSSPLMHIEGFLEALTNANKDGRIVINKQDLLSRSSLKFLLLNPVVHFSEIVSEARAVIVAGGTMQPLAEFKEQLFFAAGAKPDRIIEYSCGHVIPDGNLLPISLGRGSSGMELDFTYSNRDSPQMMAELGRVIYNLCHIVPGGIVVFFPSYEYERVVYEHWTKEGFLTKMHARKKVFREPKKASQADGVLNEYTSAIKNADEKMTGAMLLCVVGGKMSEGINFSDELGRCVVMVGLPYPNMRSPELKEKMDYLNATQPRGSDGKLPGQQHYENLCFKAVNQSIGRAIRHRNDYASIVLLDQRYLRPAMRSKLPQWISSKLCTESRFGPGFAAIRKFFSEKAKQDALQKQMKQEAPDNAWAPVSQWVPVKQEVQVKLERPGL